MVQQPTHCIQASMPFQTYQQAFTAYIRNPKHAPMPAGVDKKRMKIYAELVLNNMDASVSACFPVSKMVLGKRAWLRLIKQFMRLYAADTPIFREIPAQFLNFLEILSVQHQTAEQDVNLPAFFYSLAHYEWVELSVAINTAQVVYQQTAAPLLFEAIPVLNPTLMNLSYVYPVHTLSKKRRPRQASTQAVHLLVYRSSGHVVQFVEVNAMTATLIDLLNKGIYTGHRALQALVHLFPQENASSMMHFGSALLQQLHQQEVIVGVNAQAKIM